MFVNRRNNVVKNLQGRSQGVHVLELTQKFEDQTSELQAAQRRIAELQALGFRKILLFEKAMQVLCEVAELCGHPSVDKFIKSVQTTDYAITATEDLAACGKTTDDPHAFEVWLDECLQKVKHARRKDPTRVMQESATQTERNSVHAEVQTEQANGSFAAVALDREGAKAEGRDHQQNYKSSLPANGNSFLLAKRSSWLPGLFSIRQRASQVTPPETGSSSEEGRQTRMRNSSPAIVVVARESSVVPMPDVRNGVDGGVVPNANKGRGSKGLSEESTSYRGSVAAIKKKDADVPLEVLLRRERNTRRMSSVPAAIP
eukprot:TRINITY_DN94558_c0_g1_i1.p1 TRINITY_DN94558_c0_g1~~TRINITY_DN94558_c0_g1_i1.p1  ORF type:complete len:316 (-),score=63.46 TRINITY_DN94558_c0_g1_i1:45-992(-)